MEYVYLLKADRRIYNGHLMKIGKTIRSPKQRLKEINKSWAVRGIQWRIVRVMTVFDCSAKEAELHRRYKSFRLPGYQVSQMWGGVCDGDSEIFTIPRADRKELLHYMGAYSWSFDWKTWVMLGLGVGLCLGAWVWRSQVPTVERVRSVMEIPR